MQRATIIASCISVMLLTGCGSSSGQDDHQANTSPAPNLSGYSDTGICRAVIATVMGRDIRIIDAVQADDEIHVAYRRKSDGVMWTYKCRVSRLRGSADWGAQDGRWRTDAMDSDITLSTDAQDNLVVDDSQTGSKTFTRAEITQPTSLD